MKHIVAGILCCLYLCAYSQQLPTVRILQDSIRSSFRGLSVPSDDVVWVSGSNGTVGKSVDGGKSWRWMVVPGFEKRDFRDIEAFDSLTAIIMAVDNPADILKTTDGGKSWIVVFHKEQEGMFLDAMDFKGNEGICIGDPVKIDDSTLAFYIISTPDQGATWWELHDTYGFLFQIIKRPRAANNEAVFAGSGTNISLIDYGQEALFVTGGQQSNLHGISLLGMSSVVPIPIMQGTASKGAFSLYSPVKKHLYITGGDYKEYWKDSGNVVYTLNAGKTWKRSSVHGYRSCIIQTGKKTFITCGTNGVDISFDGCKTWKLIHGDGAKGTDGFNVCAKSKTGKAVYFAGSGRIGKLVPR